MIHLDNPPVPAEPVSSPLHAQSSFEMAEPAEGAAHAAGTRNLPGKAQGMGLQFSIVEATAVRIDASRGLEEFDHGSVQLNRSWLSHALELAFPTSA